MLNGTGVDTNTRLVVAHTRMAVQNLRTIQVCAVSWRKPLLDGWHPTDVKMALMWMMTNG